MNYLFIHQNFPGQYRHIVRHLAAQPGNNVYFITQPNSNEMALVKKITYRPSRRGLLNCHPLTVEMDSHIRNGAAVAEVCRKLKDQGVMPDLIVGHSGWGETLFVKDVFPEIPLLAYFEFYYHANGVDVGFDSEFESIFRDSSKLRVRNSVNLMGFDAADWGHTPTSWQHSLYPAEMRRRISILHEGVDTDIVRPNPNAWVEVAPENLKLSRADEVITYVSRHLEPYRGFHIFMRALPEILRRRPKAHVLIVGGDQVSYGNAAPAGTTYRELMLQELRERIDLNRVHFLGQIPYSTYLNLLQISSVHVYLTYPFVLSWSFIEAMASGCLVIGSRTPPVVEVLKDGVNGFLVDFFDVPGLVDRVVHALGNRNSSRLGDIGAEARRIAQLNFDLKRRQLPRWETLLSDLIGGKRPAIHPRRQRFHSPDLTTDLRRETRAEDSIFHPEGPLKPSAAGIPSRRRSSSRAVAAPPAAARR